MKLINFIEEKFWFPIGLALLLALILPSISKNFNTVIILLAMFNFFLACLKIDFVDVVKHIKKPLFIIYILIVYLLVIPISIYFLYKFVSSDLAIAMLLLSSVPPGAASPLVTDIFKGNISLSMTIALLGYIISPLTIVLLFFMVGKNIQLNLIQLFEALLIINLIPLFLAQLIRKLSTTFIEKTQKYYSFVGICSISLIVFLAISVQANQLKDNLYTGLTDLIWLYLFFIFTYVVSYFIAFWRNKADKIAIATTKTFMNNAIAIGIAAAFFNPNVVFLMVLSEFPWSTTLGPFKILLKHLK